ncbi:GntR family transcriptional regulator [Geminicoccaceae bacterium 1502E]|nr:GntR family transcriptional regulator [Geminicoccaceae bacterium 1502E]
MTRALHSERSEHAFPNLPEQVARRIADAVIRGELEPGAHLREQEFSDRYGVSRGTVREAIRILERDGVATIIPRRGAVVTSLAADEIREVYEVREVLFGQAAALCAERRPDTLPAELAGIVHQMAAHARDGDVTVYAALSNRLAVTIIAASRNARLLDLFNRMSLQIARYTNAGLMRPQRRAESLANWKRLVASIGEGDAGGAERMAREQIRRVKEEVVGKLETPETRV